MARRGEERKVESREGKGETRKARMEDELEKESRQ